MCLRMRGTGFLLFLLRQLGEEVDGARIAICVTLALAAYRSIARPSS